MIEFVVQVFWATVAWIIITAAAYPLWKRLTLLGRALLIVAVCLTELYIIKNVI